jgi:hypothetical protein
MRALLALVATATSALAQAPGEVQPVGAPAPSVMARRWAVALSLGSLGLTPDRQGADTVTFGVLELAGRFRIAPAIELGVSFTGGGAMEGELETGGLFVDARYRFLANRPWNVFALLSLGVVSVALDDAPDDAKRGRGALRLGFGVERRFRALALQAELRLVGVGENADYMVEEPTPAAEVSRAKLNGGSLTIGGVYYW